MIRSLTSVVALVALVLSLSAQQKSNSTSAAFHNDRLKTLALKDSPVTGDDNLRLVSGFWVSESKDSAKTLVFPMQVKIVCTRYDKTCREFSITLGATEGIVSLADLDDTEYSVNTWVAHGLLASYGGDSSSKCQRHVLTMDFDSGAVSVSDIPTHQKGCEAFIETNSYRLVRGNYYVDTSPGNDMDKPRK